ncbi:MAG: PAS domain-containing protein [Haloarculaceae archaeon]
MNTHELAHDAVLLRDPTGLITDANDQVADVFGYEPGAVLGKSFEVLLTTRDGADYPDNEELGRQAAESVDVADLALRGLGHDGRAFPFEVTLSPLELDGLSRLIAVVRDVSAPAEVQKRCRSTLERIPDRVVVADIVGGDIVDVSQEAVDRVTCEREVFLEMTQWDLHPDVDASAYREIFQRHVRKGLGYSRNSLTAPTSRSKPPTGPDSRSKYTRRYSRRARRPAPWACSATAPRAGNTSASCGRSTRRRGS